MTTKQRKMTEGQFLEVLAKTGKAYKWQVEDGKIFATGRNHCDKDIQFTPESVVKRFTRRKNLGLNELCQSNLVKAVNKMNNRGHVQVLRGRIKKAVGLS